MTIKTNGVELVAVEVPVGATGFAIVNRQGGNFIDKVLCDSNLNYLTSPDELSANEIYSFIGLLSDLTEQQAFEYAERSTMNWLNCKAKHALDYTLTVNGLDTSKPILLIKKLSPTELK
jgi:hypothetical protein